MRHDPAAGALVIMLRSLKMHGMAQAVDELAQQGAPAFEAAIPVLSQLLKAETAEREVRSMAYQLKAARFPAYRDLAGFDFASSEVNEALVRQLHRCDFIEPSDNVVLVGGPDPASQCSPPYVFIMQGLFGRDLVIAAACVALSLLASLRSGPGSPL